MRDFWALFIVTLKNTLSLTESTKKKSKLAKLLPLFLLVAFAPTLVSFFFLTQDALKFLIPIQQEGVIIGLMLLAMSMMIFFLAIFLIPAVFYFSKDVEVLLALPLRAHTIVAAKLAVSMIYEYITVFMIGIPVLAGYCVAVKPDLMFYPMMILIVLLAPVVPLIMSGLIVMIVLGVFPKTRNRDLFNYLSGFFALAFALGLNIGVQSIADIDGTSMINLLIQGNNSLITIFGYLIPSVPFAVKAVVHLNFVDLLISLAIGAAFIVVFLIAADLLYFRTAVGVNETGASRKVLKEKAYVKSTLRSNPVLTYTIKELKLLVRTPIYLLNNISTVILMPVIMIGSLMTGVSQEGDFNALIKSIPWDQPQVLSYVIAAGVAIGLFMTSLNLITPTSISREGTQVYFMKFIPMSYSSQVQAKVNSGLIISVLGILCMLIPFAVLFKVPLLSVLLAFIAALLSSVMINYLGMGVDLIHPKLVWEQEAAAVKQNINFAFTMLPAIGLGAAVFFMVGWFKDPRWFAFTIFLSLFILDVLSVVWVKATCRKAFDAI